MAKATLEHFIDLEKEMKYWNYADNKFLPAYTTNCEIQFWQYLTEIVQSARVLIEWLPEYSEGSAGYVRKESLKGLVKQYDDLVSRKQQST